MRCLHGEHVNEELAEMTRKHAEEIAKLQQELQDAVKAADQKLERTLKQELTKGEKKYQRLYEQQEALKADRRNEMRIVEQEFDRLHHHIEAGNKVMRSTHHCMGNPFLVIILISTGRRRCIPEKETRRCPAPRPPQPCSTSSAATETWWEKKKNVDKYLKVGAVADNAVSRSVFCESAAHCISFGFICTSGESVLQ